MTSGYKKLSSILSMKLNYFSYLEIYLKIDKFLPVLNQN